MDSIKLAFVKTLLHTFELVVVFAVVYLVLTAFKLPLDETITSLVVASLVKFVRSWDKIPVSDYINDR